VRLAPRRKFQTIVSSSESVPSRNVLHNSLEGAVQSLDARGHLSEETLQRPNSIPRTGPSSETRKVSGMVVSNSVPGFTPGTRVMTPPVWMVTEHILPRYSVLRMRPSSACGPAPCLPGSGSRPMAEPAPTARRTSWPFPDRENALLHSLMTADTAGSPNIPPQANERASFDAVC